MKSQTISAEIIHEEDEEAFASTVNQGSNNMGSNSNMERDEGLTQEEQESKRKGIRDMIFKSEFDLGGILQ